MQHIWQTELIEILQLEYAIRFRILSILEIIFYSWKSNCTCKFSLDILYTYSILTISTSTFPGGRSGATPTPTLTMSLNTINMRTQQASFTCNVTYNTNVSSSINTVDLSLYRGNNPVFTLDLAKQCQLPTFPPSSSISTRTSQQVRRRQISYNLVPNKSISHRLYTHVENWLTFTSHSLETIDI